MSDLQEENIQILNRVDSLIRETKIIVNQISVGKANFLMAAYFLFDLWHILEVLSQSEDIGSSAFSETSLQRLANLVESIHDFAKRCSSSCRILLLLRSTELVSELSIRFSELFECLELMLQVTATPASIIEDEKRKLKEASFYVEPEHERIREDLRAGLANEKIDKEFATTVLRQICVHLRIPFSEAKELLLELRSSLDLAKVEGRESDVQILQKLHSFLNSANIPEVAESFHQLPANISDELTIPGSFFCPITRQIMEDPVMLAEAGHTYERYAILKWFEEGKKTCPVSTKELETFELIPNLKLKQNIEEFFDLKRNKSMLHAIQQIGSDENVRLEDAVDTIMKLLTVDPKYRHLLVTLDGVRPLVSILKPAEHLREKIYRILFGIACLGDGYKALIVEAGAVPILLRILQRNPAINGGPIQLLWELSKCEGGRKAILKEPASVLIVASAFNSCTNDQKQQAEQLLNNLCDYDKSAITQAADSGVFEPLVRKISCGDRTLKIEMLKFVSRLNFNRKSLQSLVNVGVVPPLLKILHRQAADSKLQIEAAKALKHLSRSDIIRVPVAETGCLTNLIQLLASQIPDNHLAYEILEILLNLATERVFVGQIEREGAVPCLIDMLNAENVKLLDTSLKILACLSKESHTVRHSLVESGVVSTLYSILRRGNLSSCSLGILNIVSHLAADHDTRGSITNPPSMARDFINFLANGTASLDVVEPVLIILSAMVKMNETKSTLCSETRLHEICVDYLKSDREKIQESAVVILSKITTVPDDSANLRLPPLQTSVLVNLARLGLINYMIDLLKRGSERSKRHAASTLGNLSMRTHELSEKQTLIKKILAKLGFSKYQVCKVHAGKCSSKGTLCLVESEAVPHLIDLLKDGQNRSSQRAIDALCTLIKTSDDKIIDKGIDYLVDRNIILHLVQLIGTNEVSTEKAVMMLERVFKCRKYRGPRYSSIAKHALYTTMATGNQNIRAHAVKALMHLRMVPQTSTYTRTN